MKSPKKFKFEYKGMMFELPIKFLKRTDWYGKPLPTPEIDMNQVATASVIKQYVKKVYPQVTVSAKSRSFSMGCSTDIYISDNIGNSVDESIIDDVNSFGAPFVYGYFNGMEDMYEMNDSEISTDNKTTIKAGTKYLHVANRAQFCSLPDVARMLIDMTTTENYVFGKLSVAKAIEQVKGFGGTDNNISKALKLITI